jgi:hypothetical protein
MRLCETRMRTRPALNYPNLQFQPPQLRLMAESPIFDSKKKSCLTATFSSTHNTSVSVAAALLRPRYVLPVYIVELLRIRSALLRHRMYGPAFKLMDRFRCAREREQ